jgi:hypothetical protein
MAIKATLGFGLLVTPDGVSKSITVVLATAPITFTPGSGATLNPTFTLSQLAPTAVNNLSSSDGQAITGTLGLLNTVLTITWPNAPTGAQVAVTGDFEF